MIGWRCTEFIAIAISLPQPPSRRRAGNEQLLRFSPRCWLRLPALRVEGSFLGFSAADLSTGKQRYARSCCAHFVAPSSSCLSSLSMTRSDLDYVTPPLELSKASRCIHLAITRQVAPRAVAPVTSVGSADEMPTLCPFTFWFL